MGTLTGEVASLSEHCDHKLPTSCRLTASPKCCACQDVRPHTEQYSIYIDGVGLVPRGTRWHRYCYFCKEFWNNRVLATSPQMQPRETCIPNVPDQKPFIERWFEFHRGYRIVSKGESGQEERETVICQKPWKDVDPGTLPVSNEEESLMILNWSRSTQSNQNRNNVSLDDTLDALLEAANQEETTAHSSMPPTAHGRTHSHFNELQNQDSEALVEAQRQLDNAEHRYRLAELRKQRAICELEAADQEFHNCQTQRSRAQQTRTRIQYRLSRQQERGLTSETTDPRSEISQRAAQRLARIFGTREEIERQGSEYISPLTSMFSRAYERYRVAEDVRAAERASEEAAARNRDLLAEMAQAQHPQWLEAIEQEIEREFERGFDQVAVVGESLRTLDDDMDNRPPPKSTEQMTIKLTCKVCLQQIADTAVLPCGHLVMCSYCADICVPPRPSDFTQPLGRSQCPLCRKQVKRRARIYTS